MGNPLTGEVEIAIGDRQLILHFPARSLIALEARLDLSVDEVIPKMSDNPRLGLLTAVFWFGLRSQQPDLLESEAEDLFLQWVKEVGSEAAGMQLGQAFVAQFARKAAEVASGAARPRRPPRRAAGGTGTKSTSPGLN